MPSLEENPFTQGQGLEISWRWWKITNPCGSPKWRFCDHSMHRFDSAAECDRQTDRQTNGRMDGQTSSL